MSGLIRERHAILGNFQVCSCNPAEKEYHVATESQCHRNLMGDSAIREFTERPKRLNLRTELLKL